MSQFYKIDYFGWLRWEQQILVIQTKFREVKSDSGDEWQNLLV